MDLNATFGTVITVFKVLDDTALTKCVQALSDRGGFDQVTSAQVAGNEVVKVFDQGCPLSGHGQPMQS